VPLLTYHRTSQYRASSILRPWNIGIVLSIVWFILSVELTLSWNRFEGINDIGSPGQLIPLIIGCVSTSIAIKKLMLLGVSEVNPSQMRSL